METHDLMRSSRRERLTTAGRFLVTMLLLALLFGWGLVLNVNTGSVEIPAGEVFHMVWSGVKALFRDLFTGSDTLRAVTEASSESKIIFSIRMPRMLLAAILGGALSVSGYLLQTFFRNPLADPIPGDDQLRGADLVRLCGLPAHCVHGAALLPAGAKHVHAAGHRHYGGLHLQCCYRFLYYLRG